MPRLVAKPATAAPRTKPIRYSILFSLPHDFWHGKDDRHCGKNNQRRINPNEGQRGCRAIQSRSPQTTLPFMPPLASGNRCRYEFAAEENVVTHQREAQRRKEKRQRIKEDHHGLSGMVADKRRRERDNG